jgi:hypothetical protein
MIAANTSTCVAFLERERGADADLLDRALNDKQVVMVPVVLTELLSDPTLDSDVGLTLCALPLVEAHDGFGAEPAVCVQRSWHGDAKRGSEML